MKRIARIAAAACGIILVASCASTEFAKVREDRRIVVDAESGEPVAGARVEVVVYRLDTLEVEARANVAADERGRVEIPGKAGHVSFAGQVGVRPRAREQSYWVRAEGHLPLFVDLWSNAQAQPTRPTARFRVFPESSAERVPETVTFRTEFVERGDQSLFVPATQADGPLALEILGARGFLPLADVFERCECRKAIEERLDGATVSVTIDGRMGVFVDWPDAAAVHMAFEDGSDVGAWLIAEGLAIADFRFEHDRADEYNRLEDEATAAGKGVWGVLKAIGAESQ